MADGVRPGSGACSVVVLSDSFSLREAAQKAGAYTTGVVPYHTQRLQGGAGYTRPPDVRQAYFHPPQPPTNDARGRIFRLYARVLADLPIESTNFLNLCQII